MTLIDSRVDFSSKKKKKLFPYFSIEAPGEMLFGQGHLSLICCECVLHPVIGLRIYLAVALAHTFRFTFAKCAYQ